MTGRSLPTGWPREVPPPVGDQWVPAAVAWLLDRCPPEYRSHALLRRQPEVLARFAVWQVEAQEAATRKGLAAARRELRGVGAGVVDEAVMVLEHELARIQVCARSVAAIELALHARLRPVG